MPIPESEIAHGRPTRLIVDRSVLRRNAEIVRERISPTSTLMAVVKADGYGHGAVEVARCALSGGAEFLGVATVLEGVELRRAGIDAPILVLGSSAPVEAPVAAAHHIAIGVGDLAQAGQLLETLERSAPAEPLRVHLKIDTGMRRFGIPPGDAPGLAQRLTSHRSIRLDGVYSHFADADAEVDLRMQVQAARFAGALQAIRAAGIDPGIAHISNSAALLRNSSTDFGMVRAGICLYGIAPSEHVALFEGMQGAIEWRATIQHLIEMAPGDRTGYGGTYVASEQERLALLPVGYADGYSRQLSGTGWAGFEGVRLPVRGRVTMDQCVVGIPPGVSAAVGDEVYLLGNGTHGEPTPNELAEGAGTIGYEIVSRISRRVPVEYV